MEKVIEVKGKSLNEALDLAAKQLNTTVDNIKYEVIEETNKTLFNILAPKYVIIKAEVLDNTKVVESKPIENKVLVLTEEEKEKVKVLLNDFLTQLLNSLKIDYSFEIIPNETVINVDIKSNDAKIIIGYRGEVLEAIQTIVNLVISNKVERNIKIQIDVEKYREKRRKTLEELALNVAESVTRTGKSIALEPMNAYERKIIHLTLQDNNKLLTTSVGEEPYRKVVVKLK